jgi:hypothetical protein
MQISSMLIESSKIPTSFKGKIYTEINLLFTEKKDSILIFGGCDIDVERLNLEAYKPRLAALQRVG